MHLAKPVLQGLSAERKMRGHRFQAERPKLGNRLRRRPFYIDSAKNVCLLRRKRRQEHVKTAANQFFKLIVASWIWMMGRCHERNPSTDLQMGFLSTGAG